MKYYKNILLQNRYLLFILLFYFLLHLLNLTLLPSYNDESIYLDWGWTQTHIPGHLYDSLLDAKQPLMLWIIGIFENFFADPLFAGRLVSVIIGSATLVAIYKLAKVFFNKNIALFSAALYPIIPIVVFYNRQALMESAIACVGIWSFYAVLTMLHQPTSNNGIKLGVILGIGFFTKSSSLLFFTAATCILFYYIFVKRRTALVKPYLVALASFFCVDILLFINPLWWQTFSTNDRYSYTLAEIFSLPVQSWWIHLTGALNIIFFFMTPFIFLFSILGLNLMRKKKLKNAYVFGGYFLIALLIEIFIGRTQNQRYLVPFITFLIIPAAYYISILWKGVLFKKSLVLVTILIPLMSTLMLILTPDNYIMQLSKYSNYSNIEYVRGQMSGYGINEVMHYIKQHSISNQPTLVFFALNSGNPENAIDVYTQKDPQLFGLHIDSRIFPNLSQYKCLSSQYPVFFVTRYEQQSNMNNYFAQEKSFLNPDQRYHIGVYTLKKNCKGNTLSISDFYQPALSKMIEIRSGK